MWVGILYSSRARKCYWHVHWIRWESVDRSEWISRFTPPEDEKQGKPLVHAEPSLAAVLQSLLRTGDSAVASHHAACNYRCTTCGPRLGGLECKRVPVCAHAYGCASTRMKVPTCISAVHAYSYLMCMHASLCLLCHMYSMFFPACIMKSQRGAWHSPMSTLKEKMNVATTWTYLKPPSRNMIKSPLFNQKCIGHPLSDTWRAGFM